jgi:hypothetical protein
VPLPVPLGGSYPITISQGGLLVNDGYELQRTSANLTVGGTAVTPTPTTTITTTTIVTPPTPPVTSILTTSATTVLTGFTTSL